MLHLIGQMLHQLRITALATARNPAHRKYVTDLANRMYRMSGLHDPFAEGCRRRIHGKIFAVQRAMKSRFQRSNKRPCNHPPNLHFM